MKKRRFKKNKGLVVIKSLIAIGALSAAVISGYCYAAEKDIGVINKNVYIENINLGGKKPSEAKELLQQKFGQPLAAKRIEITANDKTYILDIRKLEAKYNIDVAVNEALHYGQEGNIIERLKAGLSKERKDFKLSLTYNTKPIDEIVNKIEKEVNKTPANAKISINSGEIKITPEVDGLRLQKDKLRQDIISEIQDKSSEVNSKITAALDTAKAEITSAELSEIDAPISSFSTNFSTSIPIELITLNWL